MTQVSLRNRNNNNGNNNNHHHHEGHRSPNGSSSNTELLKKKKTHPQRFVISMFSILFCFSLLFYSTKGLQQKHQKPNINGGEMFQAFDKSKDHKILPTSIVESLDAIFVLGGGVPTTLHEPPIYVQRRCDVAAAIVQQWQAQQQQDKSTPLLPILTLSAGTAHLPQFMGPDGLPVWESTSSAAYLKSKHGLSDNVFVETTSYDTISNAFYARTSFTDITGWKTLLIITNEFHMERTKLIFDWIFGVQRTANDNISNTPSSPYTLIYLACDDIGLSGKALRARQEHEQKGFNNIRDRIIPQYSSSLLDVWTFLNQKHDFYSSKGLIQRAESNNKFTSSHSALKDSYGGGGGGA